MSPHPRRGPRPRRPVSRRRLPHRPRPHRRRDDLRVPHDGRASTLADPRATTFLELTDATDLRLTVERRAGRAPAYDGAPDHAARPAPAQRGGGRGAGALRHRRRRDAHVHRPGRRRDLRRRRYCGMDIAQRVFACFDQPDLKAPITLTVTAPRRLDRARQRPRRSTSGDGAWHVRHHAADLDVPVRRLRRARGTRAPGSTPGCRSAGTPARRWPPSSTATSTSCARITEALLRLLRRALRRALPVRLLRPGVRPGPQLGRAWRRPAASPSATSTSRAASPDAGELVDRATVIAHEMAHMWFGDLVTMSWWEDTWLNESFADYMGYRRRRTRPASPARWLDFTLEPQADRLRRRRAPLDPPGRRRTPSTCVDVDTAFTNFDMITYAKGNVGAPPAGDLARRRDFLAGRQRAT